MVLLNDYLLRIQKGASEDPLPPGGVSQFSLECIFTAPSIPVNRRRKVPFKKQVFDKDIRLREYDPNPELITDAYKIRPGPRAGVSLFMRVGLAVCMYVCMYTMPEKKSCRFITIELAL